GLGKAGAEPAKRLLPGHLGNAREGVGNRLALLVRTQRVEPHAVGPVVAEDLPAELDRGPDDLRMVVADVAVQGRAGADAVLAEHIHPPPDADPVAVITLRPRPHRGRIPGGRARERGNAAGERKELDVGDDPECQARATRPLELWAVPDRGVRKRAIVTR